MLKIPQNIFLPRSCSWRKENKIKILPFTRTLPDSSRSASPAGPRTRAACCCPPPPRPGRAAPPFSSCTPSRSLPRRFDPPGRRALAGRRRPPPARQTSSTSPWEQVERGGDSEGEEVWLCVSVCMCVSDHRVDLYLFPSTVTMD